MVRLVVLLLCVSMATTQKPSNFNFKEKGFKSSHNYDIDPQVLEIQRQNLITQKILQRYLERRLHPGRKPQIRVPSVEEILPKPFATPASVRDVRQQNQSSSSETGSGGSSGGARYDLFDGRQGRKYGRRTPEDGDAQEQEYGEQETEEEEGGGDYREGRLDLDQYDDDGDDGDEGGEDNGLGADRFDIESLQSGESEHVDSFYRDKHYHRQRVLDSGESLDENVLDEDDFVDDFEDDDDDPERSVLSEITNEIRLRQEAARRQEERGRAGGRVKRQAINSRTSRRGRVTFRETPSLTNRVDARYYTSDDYVDYPTTTAAAAARANKNLRDNYSEYRLLSKNRAAAAAAAAANNNEQAKAKASRARTTSSTRNAVRSRNRNTLKSLAYKPNVYSGAGGAGGSRRPTFTLSAYSNNKAPTRPGSTRRTGSSSRASYKGNGGGGGGGDDELPGRSLNRFGGGQAGGAGPQDWRRKAAGMGGANLQPSTAALTVTFFLPTDTTVSVVANSKTEISLLRTTTTSVEEICTSCFSLAPGPNGQPVHVLNKEITSFNSDGLFEITRFILSSTPTTTVSVSQNTFRGRSTAYSATISTTLYAATPFVQTRGGGGGAAKPVDPNSVLSNAPLANILLSQLLLGNLGVGPEPNYIPRATELLGGAPEAAPRYQLVVTTTTDYRTHVQEVVQTVTQTKSIVLPVTFQGREILTTVYESDVTSTVVTSYVTETLTVPTTATIRLAQPTVHAADELSNKLSLLLPLLEERERQNRLLSAAAVAAAGESSPLAALPAAPPPAIEPTPTATSAVSKVYVSGQHPGEFSVSFTTIFST